MAIHIILVVLMIGAGFLVGRYFFVKRAEKKQMEVLAQLACPYCGSVYGVKTAQQAQYGYLIRCQEAKKQNPHLRINFEHRWDVRCPKCQAGVQFYYETGKLETCVA